MSINSTNKGVINVTIKLSTEDIEKLKEFILWAKSNGIAALQLDKMSVSFFPEQPKPIEFNLDELKQQEKEEDLLFHSSR